MTERWTAAQPTEVFHTYWRFAVERQAMFFRRLRGFHAPWTIDPILQQHKFTNTYRASDRVSQYLIRNVIYSGSQEPEEIFFRVLMFKLFNRVDTWHLLQAELGQLTWANYSYNRYDRVLSDALERRIRIYSGAYIMPSGPRASQLHHKHSTHLKLIEEMMADAAPRRLQKAPSMRAAFGLLRTYKGIGDFLAYQYLIDLNYSTLTDFCEMDFVVPGPGARDGIRKCFHSLGGLSESEIIGQVAQRQQQEFEARGLPFQSLWGRPLQLIDCQNLFCEVGKYARLAHPHIRGTTDRIRIKQKFKPNQSIIHYWFPPKWGINDKVEAPCSPQTNQDDKQSLIHNVISATGQADLDSIRDRDVETGKSMSCPAIR